MIAPTPCSWSACEFIQSRALSIAASCATCSASSASAMPSTGRNTPLPTFRAEPCVHAPAQFDVLQPVQDEQRALDAGVGEMTKSAPTVSLFRGSTGGRLAARCDESS